MPGSTTELNLQTAVDSDDNADYLTVSLANSLRTLDATYNNVSGHTHSGAHQGGPIGSGAIAPGSITSAMIADGTIATADIAANAVNGAPASYGPAIPTFSTTTLTTWVATPITLTLTCTGQPVRVAGFVNWQHSAAGGASQWALYLDGSAAATLAFQHDPFANGGLQFGFDILLSPSAGSHTFTLYVYMFVAGTTSISNSVNSYMSAMEHKR